MIINIAKRLGQTKEYYFSVKLQEIRKMIADGKDVINMAIGSPDLSPSDETIGELIKQVNNPALHNYPPYQGLPEFRSAIKKWLSGLQSCNGNDWRKSQVLQSQRGGKLGSRFGSIGKRKPLQGKNDVAKLSSYAYWRYSFQRKV